MKIQNATKANFFAIILLLGLGCFLFFNYTTTKETLEVMLGIGKSVTAFAVAVSLVDFAGIARIFTTETKMKDESAFVWLMWFVWLVAAGVDIILTWWWVALQMQSVNAGANLPQDMGHWMLDLFPWAVAFMEFAIRVPLVILVGQFADSLLSGVKAKRTSFTQVPGTPQPIQMSPQKLDKLQKNRAAAYRNLSK